jgi:ubiquinol-cytochrome c reductase iron-sulfur subunit
MSNEKQVDSGRRTLLFTSCAAGGVAGLATAGAFVSTFQPSERAKAAGAPVEVDISSLATGELKTVEWRGKPVWILKRSLEMVAELPKLDPLLADPKSERNKDELTPEYARNEHRSIKPDILVAVGICTHLGCSPTPRFQAGPQPSLPDNWEGGFLCPCHGSTFDLAGRVFKNKPASPASHVCQRYQTGHW